MTQARVITVLNQEGLIAMGCHDVRRVIYFFLDGSLGDRKYRDIATHLNLCPECDQRRQISQRIRAFIRRRIARVAATERFKVRLERSLRGLRADS